MVFSRSMQLVFLCLSRKLDRDTRRYSRLPLTHLLYFPLTVDETKCKQIQSHDQGADKNKFLCELYTDKAPNITVQITSQLKCTVHILRSVEKIVRKSLIFILENIAFQHRGGNWTDTSDCPNSDGSRILDRPSGLVQKCSPNTVWRVREFGQSEVSVRPKPVEVLGENYVRLPPLFQQTKSVHKNGLLEMQQVK